MNRVGSGEKPRSNRGGKGGKRGKNNGRLVGGRKGENDKKGHYCQVTFRQGTGLNEKKTTKTNFFAGRWGAKQGKKPC